MRTVLTALTFVVASGASQALLAATPGWDLLPYRIRAVVAVAPAADLTPQLEAEILECLVARSETMIGAPWRLTAEAAQGAFAADLAATIESLTADDLPADLVGSDLDKLLLIAVRRHPAGYEVIARDFDLHCRWLSPPARINVGQRELLPAESFRAVTMAFAPLARIEAVNGKDAEILLRAGALAPRDPAMSWVAAHDVFVPLLRVNDRGGKLRKVDQVQWTYLTVAELAGSRAKAAVQTGLRSSIGGRKRAGVEQLAIKVRPQPTGTDLTIRARTASKRPLPGYDVFSFAPGSESSTLIGRTNWNGVLHIPPAKEPLRILVVKHGESMLARLPMVPGMVAALGAEVPDDDERLAAEALITGLQEQLVDLVARRRVLLARAQLQLKAGKPAEAKKLLDQIGELGTAQQFSQRLRQQQQKLTSADPRMQRQIDKLFADTQEAVARFLDRREVDALEITVNRALEPSKGPAPKGG